MRYSMENGSKPPGWKEGDPEPEHKPEPEQQPAKTPPPPKEAA